MSYRIEYDTSPKYTAECCETKLVPRFAGFLLLFLILTHCFWPAGSRKLQQMLFPWDADVTASAFSGLMDDLMHGDKPQEAVAAFCQEIVQDAKAAD